MPPPATAIGAKVVNAFQAGRMDEASQAQRLFSTFPGRWNSYGLPPVMKAALRSLGLDLGRCAPPFASVSPHDAREIELAIAELGLSDIAS